MQGPTCAARGLGLARSRHRSLRSFPAGPPIWPWLASHRPASRCKPRLSLWYVVYQGPRQARGNQAARRPLAGPSPLL